MRRHIHDLPPSRSSARAALASGTVLVARRSPWPARAGTRAWRPPASRDPADGAARPGSARPSPRSSSSVSVKTGSGDAAVRNSPCMLAIRLDQLDLIFGTARQPQVGERLRRRPGRIRSSRRIRATCWQASRDRRRSSCAIPLAEILDELVDHALLAQHLGRPSARGRSRWRPAANCRSGESRSLPESASASTARASRLPPRFRRRPSRPRPVR